MSYPHIELVKEIVAEAGEYIRNRLDRVHLQVEQKETANDLVTEVDRQVDAFLCERLQQVYKTPIFLTEESHPDTELSEATDYAWVIDPLDGTMNFVHGYPRFAISVALVKGKEVLLGCIQDVSSQSLYWAVKNEGAWRDDSQIRCSQISGMSAGLVATGFSAKQWEREQGMTEMLKPFLGNCQGLRISGTTCLDLISVASGELDAFWHYGLKPWDIAAGSLIVREAGGRCTDDNGNEDMLVAPSFVASNTFLHEEMLGRLKKITS